LRLLRELARTPESPESAPLWLRIARMVLAALVILALAQPVWRPEPDARTDAPLILVVGFAYTVHVVASKPGG